MDNGTEKPIAFASHTLAASKRGHFKLDKEALAIMFGVKRFHQYLYGRQFIIHSDHSNVSVACSYLHQETTKTLEEQLSILACVNEGLVTSLPSH